MVIYYWIYAAFYLFLHKMVVGKTITQHPEILNLYKSETGRISCSWASTYYHQVRVEWKKQISSTGEDNGTVLCSARKSEQNSSSSAKNNTITCNVTNNKTLLTIEGVTEDDEGRYVCKLIWEIPTLHKAEGNGTRLYIHDGNSGAFVLDIRFLYLTTVLIIPILLIMYCLYCKRKKKKELFLDHIYGNVKRNTSRTSKKTSKMTSKRTATKRDTKKTSV